MSVIGNQERTFVEMLRSLRPHWRRDPALPDRIQELLGRRGFGSHDRRLYRELIYAVLRHLPWIEPLLDSEPARAVKTAAWLAAATRDTAALKDAVCGEWPAVATLGERAAFLGCEATAVVPGWFRPECPAVFLPPELDAQVARAPLWLRLQTRDAAAVAAEFAANGWRWRESEVLGSAWRLLDDADLTRTNAYRTGAIEIQDLGSQLVLESVGIPPAGRWLDACAGAGGKTLQLARILGAAGEVDAFDIRPGALVELETRARRATRRTEASDTIGSRRSADGTTAAIRILPAIAGGPARRPGRAREARIPAPGNPAAETAPAYDGVLVDAPCSGSGTWRRAPHLKWVTSPKQVANRAALQVVLLARFAAFVRSGGRLVYATCSLARRENESVVAEFLDSHPDFSPEPHSRCFGFEPSALGLTVLPARHDTDGFFVASLRRR